MGWYPSIAIGDDGLAVISHHDRTKGDLLVTKCTNDDCSESTTTVVDSTNEVGLYSSLAIGSDGFPIISLVDVNFSSLWVTHCNDHACSDSVTTPVDNAASSSTSITIGADDRPLIAASTGSKLRVTRCNNATCTA